MKCIYSLLTGRWWRKQVCTAGTITCHACWEPAFCHCSKVPEAVNENRSFSWLSAVVVSVCSQPLLCGSLSRWACWVEEAAYLVADSRHKEEDQSLLLIEVIISPSGRFYTCMLASEHTCACMHTSIVIQTRSCPACTSESA